MFDAEEQLLGTIFDIFVAGSETTSHTLGFALLFMILHPEIQSKVQQEIDEILQGRLPSLTDRGRYLHDGIVCFMLLHNSFIPNRLPYTEASLQEIQRLGVVAPLTIPHVALENTKCQGYDIPKVCRTIIHNHVIKMI